jgi:C4-dicarboxylate-specific signal transduction histidine kinase
MQVTADFLQKMIERGQQISDEELADIAEDISRNVQRASGIIQHMRDFSRQSEVVRTRLNINNPIRDVFKVLGHQLEVHEVALDLDLVEDLPPIYADHNRLEQVFINLVTNAVDAMDAKAAGAESGAVEKRLVIRSALENGQVKVTVSDTGTGMSKELQEKIFEPFFTTKEVGKGTGLGVSISYGIVKDYDGVIEVQSREGEGTTFKLRFPVVD